MPVLSITLLLVLNQITFYEDPQYSLTFKCIYFKQYDLYKTAMPGICFVVILKSS